MHLLCLLLLQLQCPPIRPVVTGPEGMNEHAVQWVEFGFCATRNVDQEDALAQQYKRLMQTHTFEEIYAAFNSLS
eukprot:4291705-Pyramimonas_sp.AAC.1